MVVRLRWLRRRRLRLTAVRAGPLQAALCSRSPAEVLRAGLSFVVYDVACLEIVLLGKPKPPSL